MPTPKIALGRIIQQRRKELGLSQKELAAKCGMKESRIGRLERGESDLHYPEVDRLLPALLWTHDTFRKAYRHASEAPEEQAPRRTETSEVREIGGPIFDLRQLEPGGNFGLRLGDRLYVLRLEHILHVMG